MQLSIQSIETPGPPEARGPGHRARMAIASVRIPEHSPFLVMAEDWFAPPAGFPTHPHRGVETVTFVVSGELVHADHTGGAGRLGAGDVQFMTAGGGVLHSEMPGPNGVHSLQLWLNLPARLKRVKARYQNVLATDAPTLHEEGVEARLYAGRLSALAKPFATTWPMTLIDLKLEPGATFEAPVPVGERAFALVLDGQAAVGADQRAVKAGDVAWAEVSHGGEGFDALPVKAVAAYARVLVFASPIIDERVAMRGPFVMNTQEEILEAFADLRAGRLTAI
jgi:redox-sensitive bicupin YhaK (pirin superfamily)